MSVPGTDEAAAEAGAEAGQPRSGGTGPAEHAEHAPQPATVPIEGVYGTLAAAAAAPAPTPEQLEPQQQPQQQPEEQPQQPSLQLPQQQAQQPQQPREPRQFAGPPPPLGRLRLRRHLPRLPLRSEPNWDSSESEQELEDAPPAASPPREGRWRRTLRALRMTRQLVSRCRAGREGSDSPAPPPTVVTDPPPSESRLLVSHFAELGRDGSLVQRTVHTTVDFVHRLVPDLLRIVNSPFYWGEMDRFEAERLLENKPEGTFLLRDSAQEEYLFSVSFRRYGRSLHARVEQWERRFSFDAHDPAVFAAGTVTALIEHYKDASRCMFFEPLLTRPLPRSFVFPLSHLCRAAIVDCVGYDDVARLRLPRLLRRFLLEYHFKQPVRVRRFELPEGGEAAAERPRRGGATVRWGAPCR